MATNEVIEELHKMNASLEVFMSDARNSCLSGNLEDSQIQGFFDFILDLDYKNITTDEYFAIVGFVDLIYKKHFPLIKEKIDNFKEKVQRFSELMMLVEYAILINNNPEISLLNSVLENLPKFSEKYEIFGFELNDFEQTILLCRCLLIVKEEINFTRKDANRIIGKYSWKPIFYCVLPYAAKFDIFSLLNHEYVIEMFRDKTVDQDTVAYVLNAMQFIFYKSNAELLVNASKTNRKILPLLAKYADGFTKYPDVLKDMIIATDCEIKPYSWKYIIKCNCKFMTPILRGRKCPGKYALILAQNPQDFLTPEEAKKFLEEENDSFIKCFFENLNVTAANASFFNNEGLLETMEMKYVSKKMKLSTNYKKTELDLDKLCSIIIQKNLLNADLYLDYLSRGNSANKKDMVRYFVANRAKITSSINNLAVSIEKNEFYSMVNNNPEWADCYHTLVEMIVIRKCADPPIDDKYVPVRIPELVGFGSMLFSELPSFFTEAMENGYIPQNLYSRSPFLQQMFFAGQLVNIPFESQIEWRYENLQQQNFLIILACSCLYYEPTEKFKETPLSFISSKPLSYVILIPINFFLIALSLVTHFFCLRCTRFMDKQLTVYIILTFTVNMVLANIESVPIDCIKFMVKELEILSLQGTPQFFTEFRKILKDRMQKHGPKILRTIAQEATSLEDIGVLESLDINVFPVDQVLTLFGEMKENKSIYPEFRSRVISRYFREHRTNINVLYDADKAHNWKGVYNVAQQIAMNSVNDAYKTLLPDKSLNPITTLIVASAKTAPSGDLLLALTGVKRLIDIIASLMTPENEHNESIARLIQNVVTKAISGSKYTNYMFLKHFLELPFLSCPYKIIESLMETCSCQELYAKASEECFVRVSDQVLMKKNWRHFTPYSEVCTIFVEILFRTIIGIPGQLSMGACLTLIGQHSWSIPQFSTPGNDIIDLILERGRELENVDSNKKYGYDAFQCLALLATALYTAKMRNVFFTEIVPNIGSYPISKRIFICLIIIHQLIDSRAQIFTYTALMPLISTIAEATLNISHNLRTIDFKLLLVAVILFATFAQVDENLSIEAKKVCTAMGQYENFMLRFCLTDGTCTPITQCIDENVLKMIFRLDAIPPISQYSITPRVIAYPTTKFDLPLANVEKPDKTFPGVAKHLPFEVQIRLANKDLPPRPEKINTAMYIELFKYGDFAIRYFCSSQLNLVLPHFIPIIRDATEAINKLVDVPDPEPYKVDYSVLLKKIPKLLEIAKANDLLSDYINTIVVSLLPKYGCDIIKNVVDAHDSAYINLCSIIKRQDNLTDEIVDTFVKTLYPKAITRCAYKGATKVGYKAISAALKLFIKPNNDIIMITKSFLASKDRKVWLRGVKLIPLFPEESRRQLLIDAFKKVNDLESISLFLEVCPSEGPKRPEMFLHILKKLLEGKKECNEVSCDIIFSSLVSPYSGKEKKSELFKKDPNLWNLINEHINWIWQMYKEKQLFSDITRFPRVLPFSIRAMEIRKKLENLIIKDTMALFLIKNELKFECSMKIILEHLKTREAIHSKIFIKFPEMSEPEAGGVLRGWLTSVAEEIVNEKRDFFIPTQNNYKFTVNPKCEDFKLLEAIGRFIGLVVLHGEVLGYQISMHIIKQLINRPVKTRDLSDIEPGVYETIQWISDPNNDPEDLCLDFTVNNGQEEVELIEGGKDIELTKENKDLFIKEISNYYLCKQCEKQIEALKKGFQFVLDANIFDNLSSSEVCTLICGEQKIDVEELIANFEVIPPLTPEHPITKMFFSVIRKWDQKMLSDFFLFMTSAHIVPVGGYAFMKAKGRQPKLRLASVQGNKMPLPSALTCFSHLTIPPYKTEEEMEKGLIMAITESEGFK